MLNKIGTSKKEIIFIIVLATGFLVPSAIFQQWWLFGTFLLFFTCFGIVEWLADKFTGKTVSQHFWALKKTNKKAAWTIAIAMMVGWLSLLWHLIGK